MAHWDFQKLAKGLWTSVKQWDYFQSDEVGQRMAKAGDVMFDSNAETGKDIDAGEPPIDVAVEAVPPQPTAADASAFQDLEQVDLFPGTPNPTPPPRATGNPVHAIPSPNRSQPQSPPTAPTPAPPPVAESVWDIPQPEQTFERAESNNDPHSDSFFDDDLTFTNDPFAELATDPSSNPATEPTASPPVMEQDPFGDHAFLSLDELSLEELDGFDNLFTTNSSTTPPTPPPTPEPTTGLSAPEHHEGYQYFVTEAQDLLQTIEQELMALTPAASTADIYSLMRATHTLKGAAANVRQDTIKTIAHNLEDVFRAMLAPKAVIDAQLQSLLYESYETLRLAVRSELAHEQGQNDELLQRAEQLFDRFKAKLGDCFEHQPPLPSSSEMGFDLTQSIFETGVQERLDELTQLLASQPTAAAVQANWQTQAEVLVGLAESLILPGFKGVVEAGNQAIAQHPEQTLTIAPILLANLQAAQQQVLGGDRTSGGSVSPALAAWLTDNPDSSPPSPHLPTDAELENLLSQDVTADSGNSWGEITTASDVTPVPEQVALASDLWSEPRAPSGELEGAIAEPAANSTNAPLKAIPKTLRIDLEQLAYLNHLVGELLINQNQLVLRDGQFQESVQKLSSWLRQHRSTLNQLRDALPKGTNRTAQQLTPTQRLLYAAVEETSQISQATEDINLLVRTTASTIEREHRLAKQLRDNMEAARMMPLEALLKRFPPMVKQLAFIHKKPVELHLKGTEVLVDKTITENLYDALLHLVRNAFDHGIESAEQRRQTQKSSTGQITIAAYNQGNRTIIEVSDDGQGLNVQRICQRAVERGLIPHAESQRIQQLGQPDERLLDLLCEPGFSTAAQVNDLSGRGVGLDVVKTQLLQIKGLLQVRSQPGQGTCFAIQIRESLLSARLLICRAGRSVYGFVANEIEQVLIPGEQLRWIAGQKVLDWNQEDAEYTVPVYELAALFQSPAPLANTSAHRALSESGELEPVLTTTADVKPVMLLRTAEGLIGLEVNQILEEQELVIKPVSEAIAPPPYVYGCSILADGRLTLVLDGAMLVQHTQKQGMRLIKEAGELSPAVSLPSSPEPPQLSTESLGLFIPQTDGDLSTSSPSTSPAPPKATPQQTTLIIDDSLTERQTLTLMLERAGHKVMALKDGQEALDYLKAQPDTVSVVLCDIEMPRMNGLEFLSALRQEANIPNLPVAMLTSRSRDKFQAIALELGAYAYLTKPYVEQEILSVVAQGQQRRQAA